MELDSHADICVLEKECLRVYDWNCPVNLSSWNPKYGERLCQTISGSVAYNQPQSGKVHIFIFHRCIHFDHLDHHLLCPMQCQMNNVEVNEMPKFLLVLTIDTSHAIVVDDPNGETPMIVPLSINGVTTCFPCWKPTRSEFEDGDVLRIDFTAEAPDWDLLDRDFDER